MSVKDETGHRYGRLTVLRRAAASIHGRAAFVCQCDCGTEKTLKGEVLRDGRVRSCGCFRREAPSLRSTGKKPRSATYNVWASVVQRCTNKQSDSYPAYGGSGITMCVRWRESFAAFLADMGHRPGPAYSIDRYPNRAGNYEPGNCRWATAKQQGRNTRTVKLSEAVAAAIRTSSDTNKALAAEHGVHQSVISKIRHGVAWQLDTQPRVSP